jgi:hypothetical protein
MQFEVVEEKGGRCCTLNEALYGMPMGRFAKMAMRRFASPDLNARLCDISCIARNRF